MPHPGVSGACPGRYHDRPVIRPLTSSLAIMNRWTPLLTALTTGLGITGALACSAPATVCPQAGADSFALIAEGRPASVLVENDADSAVRRVADDFALDLERVSGRVARRVATPEQADGPVVVIGVLGQSPLIDGLVQAGKLDAGDIAGRWEAFRMAVVEAPWPGTERALIIAGADRRGAVFGSYDLSEALGVSPWHWFADVPVARQENVFITAGIQGDAPKVRYRGLFINDEDPAFSGWAKQRFGGVNADLYERVFELILRLKGNYLWPAMWKPKAFHLDDPRSAVLADEMGMVMGTSHHEPMARAQAEWHRLSDDPATGGAWNYASNAENLRAFWRGGIERMMAKGNGQAYDNLVTVGMRGDGDEPMSEETAIGLLETVVADQRRIIAEVTGRPAEQTPQVWALYKEGQDDDDPGMTVPDDVTLLFADDNWGQIRRLPADNPERAGGYGVYYHFDYVGAPRNYKWLNTIQVGKVWQQMNLAWERGARAVWVVNVGDLKPMEYPIDFYLRMAWDPEDMTPAALAAFPSAWAARNFGPGNAAAIGELMTRYSRFAARRKPELVNEQAFPIGEVAGPALHRGVFGDHVAAWNELVQKMERVRERISPEQLPAFFQLIEFPVRALANLYEMYWAVAWNRRLAEAYDNRGNTFLHLAEAAYARDAELTAQYHALNDGKWDGMMAGVHMNYVIWNTPTQQAMPVVMRTDGDRPEDRREVAELFAPRPPGESGGHAIDAADFDRSHEAAGLTWTALPDLGQPDRAMVALPQGRPPTTAADGVRLDYDIEVAIEGDLHVTLRLSPTLDTRGGDGLRIGVSLDDGPLTVAVSSLEPTTGAARTPAQQAWTAAVIANGHSLTTVFPGVAAGRHTLKLWRLDDNLVLERLSLQSR